MRSCMRFWRSGFAAIVLPREKIYALPIPYSHEKRTGFP